MDALILTLQDRLHMKWYLTFAGQVSIMKPAALPGRADAQTIAAMN